MYNLEGNVFFVNLKKKLFAAYISSGSGRQVTFAKAWNS